ncbi:arylesterase/monooxygenase [Mariannaea sp. PMI_226]|nr:arylesterase/monooxygenase [Mariannaea sp. PMI_226]
MAALQYDSEFEDGLGLELASLPANSPSESDFKARRKLWEQVQDRRNSLLPETEGVQVTVHHISTLNDGGTISVYRVCPAVLLSEGTPPTSAILHAHSGGMIVGSVPFGLKRLRLQAAECQLQIFSVDYRLAPESPHPGPVNDCYAALEWLATKTQEFNIDPHRVAVMGESAGGCLAAALALMARDYGFQPPLAKQILIYPMLDDRTVKPDPVLEPFANWKYDNNFNAWAAVLGGPDKVAAHHTDPYAAPARAKSLAGLPSTYVEVGGLDIFRDEAIEYAYRIMKENINCELHVYAGVAHSFESIAPASDITKRALRNQYAAMKGI